MKSSTFLIVPALAAALIAGCGGSSGPESGHAASATPETQSVAAPGPASPSAPDPLSPSTPDATSVTTSLVLASASYEVSVTGTPYDWARQDVSSISTSGDNYFYRYGVAPAIVLREIPGGGYAIAWNDPSSSAVKVTSLDTAFSNPVSEAFPVAPGTLAPHTYSRFESCNGPTVNSVVSPCNFMAGFEPLGASNYYLAYTDFSSRYGTAAAGSNKSAVGGQLVMKKNGGATVFQDAMADPSTGAAGMPLTALDTLVNPLQASTMRMAHDGQYLAYFMGLESYVGGTPLYHQGGFIRYIQDGGTPSLVANGTAGYASSGWLASHDFDQRIARVDRSLAGKGFVFAGLGDAYPRAIFAFDGRTNKRINVFPIEGAVGANATYTLLGGLAVQGDVVALSFASRYVANSKADNSGNEMNVAVALLNLSDFSTISTLQNTTGSDVSKIKYAYLTRLGAGTLALDPKLAALGTDKFLVAWREVSSAATTTANAIPKYAVLRADGTILIEPTVMPDGFQFHRTDDFLTGSDGNVYWAAGGGPNKLVVNALKLPK